jgi:hypothetical protein
MPTWKRPPVFCIWTENIRNACGRLFSQWVASEVKTSITCQIYKGISNFWLDESTGKQYKYMFLTIMNVIHYGTFSTYMICCDWRSVPVRLFIFGR